MSTQREAEKAERPQPIRLLADPIVASLVFVLAVSLFFLAFPEIDLRVSALFYAPGRGFFLANDRLLIAFRGTGDTLTIAASALLLAGLAQKLARPARPSLVRPSLTLFLFASLALAPGLLVNTVLKGEWGRPRPFMIEAFGGGAPYVPVWEISDYCARNCSFVSGEASSAAWLVAVALVLPGRWRVAGAAAACLYAAAVSINRIAFGGHFLSDVLLSFGLTLLVMAVLHRLIVERPPAWLANDALEAGLTRLGSRLRRRKNRGRGATSR